MPVTEPLLEVTVILGAVWTTYITFAIREVTRPVTFISEAGSVCVYSEAFSDIVRPQTGVLISIRYVSENTWAMTLSLRCEVSFS